MTGQLTHLPNAHGVQQSDSQRIAEFIDRMRARAKECLNASRLCLLVLAVAFIVGVVIFLWANQIVDVAVALHPPTNIIVGDTGNDAPVHVTVDQKVPERAAQFQMELEWKIRVLTQVSALAARIGVVCILLFLMQFCMRLFRYYHATHLFFLSRAEALSLSVPEELTLPEAIAFLASNDIGFGGLPESPAKLMVDILKAGSASSGAAKASKLDAAPSSSRE
jgi:hypothetical protein